MSRKRTQSDAAEVAVQRSKLRHDIREESKTLAAEKAELVRGDKRSRARTEEHKNKQDELFKLVSHAREFVLDAEAASSLSKVVAEQAQNVDVALSNDTPAEFCARVKAWMTRHPAPGGDDTDETAAAESRWRAVGRAASRHHGYAPGATFVYGAVPTVPRKEHERKERAPADKVEKAKKVAELEEDEVDPNLLSLATIEQVDKLGVSMKTAGAYDRSLFLLSLLSRPKSVLLAGIPCGRWW